MMPKGLPAEPAKPVRKPVGGYRFISVMQLSMAWSAYKAGLIQFRDLRAYFALHEMDARRCELDSERLAAFTTQELRGLVGGVGGERLSRSISRLEASGLISWSESELSFMASPDGMPGDLAGLWAMHGKIVNNKRRIPVPRRTLRLIAQTGKPVVVATILAYLLRCVYFRDKGVVGEGTCKASWAADVFGVGERNVKASKKHLASIAWLKTEETPHWHKQRFGGRAVVNLAWERPKSYADCAPELAPRTPDSAPVLTPPESDRELSSRKKNQKPAQPADTPAGFFNGKAREENPSLRDVKVTDLKDTSRLLVLYGLAVAAGLIAGSDHGRLLFVMLAEHALIKGTRNPAGLFMHLLKNKRYHFATNSDDDAAHERLKRHFYGATRRRERLDDDDFERPKRVEVKLSDDAKFVAAVERVCRERRIQADPFIFVKREKPEWTRERWDTAVGECEEARLRKLVALRHRQ